MKQNHPFHMVFMSPWPIVISVSVFSMMVGTAYWITSKNNTLMTMGTLSTIMVSAQWWRDVSRESSLQGLHTKWVVSGLRWGMMLFITSEVLFFFSFFWAFFHSSLAPNMEMGSSWPPMGVMAINPFCVPLLNTAVLLGSGVTVTWAHHSLVNMNNKNTNTAMIMTITLGMYFTMLQGWEYMEASFSMSDSSYGSVFFVATGFHGIHVLVGTLFLVFCLLRHKMNIFSLQHHSGMEMAIWYWHFVDVVWLFLFSFIYWWSF